jgi:hypothetical protein
LPTRGGFDEEPLYAPENAEKRRKHKVSRIYEKDGPLPGLRFS